MAAGSGKNQAILVKGDMGGLVIAPEGSHAPFINTIHPIWRLLRVERRIKADLYDTIARRVLYFTDVPAVAGFNPYRPSNVIGGKRRSARYVKTGSALKQGQTGAPLIPLLRHITKLKRLQHEGSRSGAFDHLRRDIGMR